LAPSVPLSSGRYCVLATNVSLRISKHSAQEIDTQVLSSLHHILKAFAYPTSHSVQHPACIVSWQRPSMDSVILNVDDNVFLNSNLGDFCGLIRDHTCSFLHGFFGKIS
jgi:hypothetical protein